jgi:hypothetical protein
MSVNVAAISTQVSTWSDEEPAKLNRDVALRAVRPNSLFSNVVFS